MTESGRSPQQAAFIVAVLQNAHELVVEAEILLRAEKWARAYALATFAVEEAGKAWMADSHFAFEPLKKLARARHPVKLAAANEMVKLFYMVNVRGEIDAEELFSEENEQMAQDDFDARMAGLYVDFEDGEVVGGPGTMTPKQAHITTAQAGEIVHIAMNLLWSRYIPDQVTGES